MNGFIVPASCDMMYQPYLQVGGAAHGCCAHATRHAHKPTRNDTNSVFYKRFVSENFHKKVVAVCLETM